MMNIETLTNHWDRENKNRIQRNFNILARIPTNIIEDLLTADPTEIKTKKNGLSIPNNMDLRLLNDFGINFTAKTDGVIYKTKIYARTSGKIGVGLHEQKVTDVAGALIKYIVVNVSAGWNTVVLNFPIRVGESYTLFKRFEGESILTNTTIVRGWNTYPFTENGMRFNAGKFLNDTKTYTNYSTFFEIELVTNPAQVFKMLNDKAKPLPQFYVGDTPPPDAQFWFKPVGGNNG